MCFPIRAREPATTPRSGNTCDSLGEAFALKGDKHQAMAGYSKALAMVKDPAIKLPLPP